jgi:hypothetical protein
LNLFAVLICCGLKVLAQNTSQKQPNESPTIRAATHLVGFENAKNNCKGELSIAGDSLQFQRGKTNALINVGSVRDVFLGEESRPVGGLPLTVGEAAVPYGGGRVVSLFAHRKYDILTVEYVDRYGGIHGAIFQLGKGQGGALKHELALRAAILSSREDQSKSSAAGVRHEGK